FIFAILLFSQTHAAELTFGGYTQQTQQQITGTVSDALGPLSNVTVNVKGTNIFASADDNGKFTIAASQSDTLVFSFIGFATQEIAVGTQTSINVMMAEDSTQLQEVTINAGYYTVKDKERTGSIARITAKDIERQPVANPLAALQGRMAGVNISQSSGAPGGGFDVQIRGRNSIRPDGNSPLYIIDGIPYGTEQLGSSFVSGSSLPNLGLNPLSTINPMDIESIEVLKDADATAIYGSRGANGVVLITTKKGKAGKTKFQFNAYSGTTSVARKLKLMNTPQYLDMRRQAFANDGYETLPDWAYDVNGTWDQNRNTDWQEELIGKTAFTNSLRGSVSGGSEFTQFLLAGTYYTETATYPGDFRYKRVAANMNLNHSSNDKKFKVTISANYSADNNTLPGLDLTRDALTLAPNAPQLYDENGNLNWENSTWDNPLRMLNEKYLSKTRSLIANGNLQYEIVSGLFIRTNIGYTDVRVDEQRLSPSTIYNPAFGYGPDLAFQLNNAAIQQSWNFEPQLNWQKDFGSSKLDVLAGATFQERSSSATGLYAGGFSSDELISNLGAASIIDIVNNDNSEYRYNAIFGRINYSFDQKYFLNLTGRRDGSSRFGPGNRFANFGAVGAAWIFSREEFLTKLPWLSFGKLRASYGTTGSDQIGNYQFLDSYASTGSSYDGIIGLQPTRLFNPIFSWETNKKLETALELGFLNDRIFISAAHFQNRSSNQLVGVPLPGTTGFTSVQANLGATVENKGWELELRGEIFRDGNLKWTSALNISWLKNSLVEFPGLEGSTYSNQYIIGQPLDIRMVYEYTGINPETGLYTFRDFDNDGRITAAGDKKRAVQTSPKYFGGIQNSISYKGWALDFLFQFVHQKGANYNVTGSAPGLQSNQPSDLGSPWTGAGDSDAEIQILTSGSNSQALTAFSRYSQSTAAFTDASYIRLKNLSLSYTLPPSWLPDANCRIYFQGQNLFTITKFNGLDPENQSFGWLPPLRTLTIGATIDF
uniref:SusC/RagA family TonB-linked outer membrane protein n=1 Tax=uncultured Flavobacterium sp. TaxID=165435 RepID=UPI003456B8C3